MSNDKSKGNQYLNKEDKKGEKIIEFFSFLSIFFLLILMISGSIRITYFDLKLSDYSMYIYINGALGLVLYICSKIKNFKFNVYEILVFVLIMLSCLSLVTAININVAVFGELNRYEGLLVWLTYYIFILNAMNIRNKKYLYIIISLVSMYCLINIFYGLYQVGVFNSPHLFKIMSAGIYARGFVGHWNFFGTLVCIFYGLMLGLFIKENYCLKKWFLIIGLIIANVGVVICGAMSSLVAVIIINVVCLVQIIVLLFKRHKKRYMYLVSFLISAMSFILVFMIYTSNNSNVKTDISQMLNETKNIVTEGEVKDNYGTGRFYIWKRTIEKIKIAPITGFGIDNFNEVFENKLTTPTSKSIVDKAHNDYLQRALCEGIISGVFFIVFLLIIFFKGILRELSPLYYGLLLAFTCYSVQAFFNISMTRVAPIYYIVIGLLLGKIVEESYYLNNK